MTSNHANDGRGFEQTLDRICRVYAERGLAHEFFAVLRKLSVPVEYEERARG